ncbi:Iron-sulfur cluster assembly protein, putative [Angomonas deanei]|uniref:Iron-sulfur cluster assembly protein, putative n=1 Tax=Angomonas deanei TaxID=59799 RepID=A0A7G2CUA4_9TRYP|nr:Iron-sulfur cluster assembly protein, putative [Angomonas deanei]
MAVSNPNPIVFDDFETPPTQRSAEELAAERDDSVDDPIDAWEVFEMIRRIRDPEHPNTLEQLRVVDPSIITVNWKKKHVRVNFTPTVPHCSLTTLIGLSIRLQLERNLPQYTKVDVYLTPGSHDQEEQVNKQLNDKERVAAALENQNLLRVVESCVYAFQEY